MNLFINFQQNGINGLLNKLQTSKTSKTVVSQFHVHSMLLKSCKYSIYVMHVMQIC